MGLYTSQNATNIRLALQLESSQKVDLSEMWEACFKLYKAVHPKEDPPTKEQVALFVFNMNDFDFEAIGLYEVPKALKYVAPLNSIRLCGNNIQKLPVWFPETKIICLHDNPIKNTTQLEFLEHSRQVEMVCLKNIQLTEFPTSTTQCNQLKIIILNDNNIAVIPTEIGQLRQLTNLHISGNNIKYLPASISHLQLLEWIDLDGNQLTDFPEVLYQLGNLTKIDLQNNPISPLKIEQARARLQGCEILF